MSVVGRTHFLWVLNDGAWFAVSQSDAHAHQPMVSVWVLDYVEVYRAPQKKIDFDRLVAEENRRIYKRAKWKATKKLWIVGSRKKDDNPSESNSHKFNELQTSQKASSITHNFRVALLLKCVTFLTSKRPF